MAALTRRTVILDQASSQRLLSDQALFHMLAIGMNMASIPLSKRWLLPERMDDPALEERLHHDALTGLSRINRFSRSVNIVWPPIRRLAMTLPGRPLRVLDVATGAGDIPVGLALAARRAGMDLEVSACDLSPRAVAFAQQRAWARGLSIEYFQLDALNDPLPSGYDVIVSSLFLHHLETSRVRGLLENMAAAAGRMLLINDLERSRAGFWLAWLGTRALSRCPVVHEDGPQSVRAAFTRQELRTWAEAAGLHASQVERRWPCRLLLEWRRPT